MIFVQYPSDQRHRLTLDGRLGTNKKIVNILEDIIHNEELME